jgi:pyruvate formate lyase activating enzyme
MTDTRNTTPDDLLRAVEIGQQAGLRYIYAGNLPGMVGHWEDTRCANCEEILVKRRGYLIEDYRLTPEGSCPSCFTPLPGRWSRQFEGQIASHPFLPRGSSRLVTIFNR